MAPKKMGVNSKAEAARARKSVAEEERKTREAREKEDAYWREAGEGQKSRAARKREEEAEKKAEAAARKAEARRLADQEEKEIDKAGKKPDKKSMRVSIPVPKVTGAELERQREEERHRILQQAEEAKKRQSRTADEEEYERMVLVQNTNRDDGMIEAHSVEDALAKMTVDQALPVDRHPERRLKASFKVLDWFVDPPPFRYSLIRLLIFKANCVSSRHPIFFCENEGSITLVCFWQLNSFV